MAGANAPGAATLAVGRMIGYVARPAGNRASRTGRGTMALRLASARVSYFRDGITSGGRACGGLLPPI